MSQFAANKINTENINNNFNENHSFKIRSFLKSQSTEVKKIKKNKNPKMSCELVV